MLYNPTALSALIGAITASGMTMLASRPHHDLARSVGIVSVVVGTVGAATAVVLHKMQRMEDLGCRIVTVDQNILDALTDPGDNDLP